MAARSENGDKKGARRDELLRVAARLFAERGFDGTSMDDIAKEMGILKGSLYYWIDSKDALLKEVLHLNPTMEEVAEAQRIIARKIPASERLRHLIHTHIGAWVRYPHNFRVFVDYNGLQSGAYEAVLSQRSALENEFKKLLREGCASGEFSIDEADLSIIVNSIFGVLNWFPRWYRPEGPASPDDIADVMTNLVLGGLTRASS